MGPLGFGSLGMGPVILGSFLLSEFSCFSPLVTYPESAVPRAMEVSWVQWWRRLFPSVELGSPGPPCNGFLVFQVYHALSVGSRLLSPCQ